MPAAQAKIKELQAESNKRLAALDNSEWRGAEHLECAEAEEARYEKDLCGCRWDEKELIEWCLGHAEYRKKFEAREAVLVEAARWTLDVINGVGRSGKPVNPMDDEPEAAFDSLKKALSDLPAAGQMLLDDAKKWQEVKEILGPRSDLKTEDLPKILDLLKADHDEWKRLAEKREAVLISAIKSAKRRGAERDRLQARVEELTKLLKPMAASAEMWSHDDCHNMTPDNYQLNDSVITFGDCRKVRRALASQQSELPPCNGCGRILNWPYESGHWRRATRFKGYQHEHQDQWVVCPGPQPEAEPSGPGEGEK